MSYFKNEKLSLRSIGLLTAALGRGERAYDKTEILTWTRDGRKGVSLSLHELIMLGYCAMSRGRTAQGRYSAICYLFFEEQQTKESIEEEITKFKLEMKGEENEEGV